MNNENAGINQEDEDDVIIITHDCAELVSGCLLRRLSPSEGTALPENKENAMDKLTHVDEQGRARMVDVGDKPDTKRRAVAQAVVTMKPDTLAMIAAGRMPKGDVFACARIAGIMAAKRTSDLIPMCHPLPLDSVQVELTPEGSDKVRIVAEVTCIYHTGVEMEALTACSVAALTVYDMCKAVDREMEIGSVMLLEKSGGKSGDFKRKIND